MLARKPRMLVILTIANKTARIAWALIIKGEKDGALIGRRLTTATIARLLAT